MNKSAITSNPRLHVEVVKGKENIKKINRDWDDLFRRAHKAPPYFSRAWVQTFMTETNFKGTPLLITVRSDSKLVALLPLIVHNIFGLKFAKVAPTTILCYNGILLDPNYPEVNRIVADVLQREKIAHVFYNKYLSSMDEPTNELIEEMGLHNFAFKRWRRHICLWTHLEPTFDQVLENRRTGKQRRWLLRKEKRVFKQGDVSVVCYTGKEITRKITARIAAIQEDSWVKAEGAAILKQTFYQKLLEEIGKAGIGCVCLMTKDGDDVAFVYALRVKNSLYPKWMSYRQKYGTSSSLSYGKVLYMQLIRYACDEGIDFLDLGFGQDKWKEVWASDKQNIDRVIAGRSIIGHTAILCYNILRWYAKIKWFLHRQYKKIRKNRERDNLP